MPPIIQLEHVTKIYRMGDVTVSALLDISLTIDEGEFVAIMGASGSGKSTLMNIIGCLDVLPMLYAGVPAAERNRRAAAALTRVGLGSRLEHRPNQLSGGQQQRVALARAIVMNPRVILADEPTGNLDSRTSMEVMALFQELSGAGITIVLVTHEPDIAAHAARCVVLRDGRILSDTHSVPRRAQTFLAEPSPEGPKTQEGKTRPVAGRSPVSERSS